MDRETLIGAVAEARLLGLHTVKITGGEPFLRRDILDIVAFLRKEDLQVDMETNGTLIDRAVAVQLARLGVRQVSVSIDSTDPNRHDGFRGMPGSHKGALHAISLLVQEGITTQIIMTLIRENLPEIEELAALCLAMKVPSLKINPVMPTGRGKDLHAAGENLTTEELIAVDRWLDEKVSPQYEGLDLCFDLPIALKSLKTILHKPLSECHVLNIIAILADGTISLCGIGETETGLNMGNIADDNLTDVWSRHPILVGLRRDVPRRLEGVCGCCIFKFRCRGACRAAAYTLTGKINAPFFLCQDAMEKGLFPASRLTEVQQ